MRQIKQLCRATPGQNRDVRYLRVIRCESRGNDATLGVAHDQHPINPNGWVRSRRFNRRPDSRCPSVERVFRVELSRAVLSRAGVFVIVEKAHARFLYNEHASNMPERAQEHVLIAADDLVA
jgi:hypothetical protein